MDCVYYTQTYTSHMRKRKEFTPHHTATDGVGRCGDFQVLRTRCGRTEEAEHAIRLRQHTATATHGTRRRAGHAHSRRELAWHDVALQRRGTSTARHGIATMIATTRDAARAQHGVTRCRTQLRCKTSTGRRGTSFTRHGRVHGHGQRRRRRSPVPACERKRILSR